MRNKDDSISVVIETTENFFKALKQFMKATRENILPELKKRSSFISPSEERQIKQRKSIRRHKKKEAFIKEMERIAEIRGIRK